MISAPWTQKFTRYPAATETREWDMKKLQWAAIAVAGFAFFGCATIAANAEEPDASMHLDRAYPNYQPTYPDAAQVNGEQGNVVLNVQITSGGKVRNIKVDQSSGFEDLDNAAIAGVMRWRFIPQDDSTEWTKVTIAYRLPTAIIVPPKAAPAAGQ
jgi:TonB family protein